MFEKLKKHARLLIRKIELARELNRMKKCPNQTVQNILKAFLAVRSNTYNQDDKEAFERCENYRNALLKRSEKVSFEIFGLDDEKTMGEICSKAASPKIWCQFLYMLAKKSASQNMLEIGTNLGISGSYLLEATAHNHKSKLITMEGVSQLCNISSRRFSEITNLDRFEIVEGLYQDTFPKILKNPVLFDIHFIDGNHQQEATLEYFMKLKEKTRQQTVFVFDDINWSKGMKKAWKTIQNDKSVLFSIDLWKLGIVITNPSNAGKPTGFKLFLSF